MLHASLADRGTYDTLLLRPAWLRALEWLREMPVGIPLGKHETIGEGMFASVMEYETVPREAARFESHREHVDLQYTISGSEGIDGCPRAELETDGPFADDVQFWLPPTARFATFVNSPGRFSVFYPGDAHRPKVRVDAGRVRKLVIKVDVKLLA